MSKPTGFERDIMARAYAKGFRHITRDRNKALFFHKTKPKKLFAYWKLTESVMGFDGIFGTDFEFVKWSNRYPYEIQDKRAEQNGIEVFKKNPAACRCKYFFNVPSKEKDKIGFCAFRKEHITQNQADRCARNKRNQEEE